MITLDSVQLLAAVQRSLNTHVLPMLEDEFARVQIAATLKVLDEVCDRLENGDPIERLNANITADALELANNVATAAPDFAAAVDRAVSSVPDGLAPREHNRRLVEGLWPLAAAEADVNAEALLKLLVSRGSEASAQDAAWLCPEALLSLI